MKTRLAIILMMVLAAILMIAMLSIAGASSTTGTAFTLPAKPTAVLISQRDSGQCFGDGASEQGICIAQCQATANALEVVPPPTAGAFKSSLRSQKSGGEAKV